MCVILEEASSLRASASSIFFTLHRDVNLNIDSLGDRRQADQVTDPVHEMHSAMEVHVPVLTVHKGPDRRWVLLSHEIEFFAEGLEETTSRITERPGGMGIEMVRPERIARVKLVFSQFDQFMCHGVTPYRYGASVAARPEVDFLRRQS